ncbi:MAG: hypothetical protein ACFFCS_07095 [Candidatus Hodarchaeota archaeon]
MEKMRIVKDILVFLIQHHQDKKSFTKITFDVVLIPMPSKKEDLHSYSFRIQIISGFILKYIDG